MPNHKQPTYSFSEFTGMLPSMDDDGIEIILKLLEEEKNLYSIYEYGQLQKSINLQKEKILFEKRRRK